MANDNPQWVYLKKGTIRPGMRYRVEVYQTHHLIRSIFAQFGNSQALLHAYEAEATKEMYVETGNGKRYYVLMSDIMRVHDTSDVVRPWHMEHCLACQHSEGVDRDGQA